MKTLEEVMQEHIRQVIDYTNWDIKKASIILKVSEDYLKKKIQKIEQTEIKRSGEK
jgi:DNA-binding NtrC family response regulator